MAPNLHPNLIIASPGPETPKHGKHASASSSNNISSTISSRSKASGSGRDSPDDETRGGIRIRMSEKNRGIQPLEKKHIWLFIFVPNVEEED